MLNCPAQCRQRTIESIDEGAKIYQNELGNLFQHPSDKRHAEIRIESRGIEKEMLLKIPIDHIIPAPMHVFQGFLIFLLLFIINF